MGNRLSNLPFPTFVGGTVECGEGLPENENARSPRRLTTAVPNLDVTTNSLANAPVDRRSGERTVSAESLMLDVSAVRPVLYASAFTLHTLDSERYLHAGNEIASDSDQVSDALECIHSTEIQTSSLITFHGPSGDQVNYRGDRDFSKVEDGAHVTVYANVRVESNVGSVGKYLAPGPREPGNIEGPDASFGKRLFWRGDPDNVKSTPEAFEFLVRRAGHPESKPSPSRSQSFRNKLRRFHFSATRRDSTTSSSAPSPPGTGNSATSQRGWKTPPPSRSTPSWNGELSVPRPSTPSLSEMQNRHTNTPVQDLLSSSGAQSESESAAPAGPANPSVVINGDVGADSQLSEQEREYLLVGDAITLESVARPGYFLVTKANGHAQLSANNATPLRVSIPQLRHLLTLNQGNGFSPTNVAGTKILNLAPMSRPKPELTEIESAWLRLLQELPLDIVYRVLQYKGRWVKVARAVSRDWCRAATLHIHRIRVNGDFHSVDEPEEREGMLAFIESCKHLANLTLRNIDELQDQDMARIAQCKYMSYLSVGGCRALGDGCIADIACLKRLKVLNLATTAITDAGLQTLANAGLQISVLNLYDCRMLTHAGIATIISMPNLESLNIRGCRVDKADAIDLQRRFPRTKLLVGPTSIDGIY